MNYDKMKPKEVFDLADRGDQGAKDFLAAKWQKHKAFKAARTDDYDELDKLADENSNLKYDKRYVPTLESFSRKMNEEMSVKSIPLHMKGFSWTTDATGELPAITWDDPHRQRLDADDSNDSDSQYLYLFKTGSKVWRGYGRGTDGKQYMGIFGDEQEDPQVWDVRSNEWNMGEPKHDGPFVDPYGNEI